MAEARPRSCSAGDRRPRIDWRASRTYWSTPRRMVRNWRADLRRACRRPRRRWRRSAARRRTAPAAACRGFRGPPGPARRAGSTSRRARGAGAGATSAAIAPSTRQHTGGQEPRCLVEHRRGREAHSAAAFRPGAVGVGGHHMEACSGRARGSCTTRRGARRRRPSRDRSRRAGSGSEVAGVAVSARAANWMSSRLVPGGARVRRRRRLVAIDEDRVDARVDRPWRRDARRVDDATAHGWSRTTAARCRRGRRRGARTNAGCRPGRRPC